MSNLNLDSILTTVTPLVMGNESEFASRITNIQSTTCILDVGYKLPLKIIAMSLIHMLKHWSPKFAAIIIRAKFGIHPTTCTVFETGKLTVVGALTEQHSLYAAQMYRMTLENIMACYYDRITNTNIITNLVNRTKFDNFRIGNVVATCKLPYRVNLKSFRDQKQRDAHYNPEAFPGCPYLVWISPRDQCKCNVTKKGKESCDCNVQSSIFDSGAFNLTGSKTIEDINRAKHMILKFTEKYKDESTQLPKNKRYEARRQEIFNVSIDETGLVHKKRKCVIEIPKLTDLVKEIPFIERKKQNYNIMTVACLEKRIDVIRDLMDINKPKYIKIALSELKDIDANWGKTIYKILKKCLEELD
jgi:TATA-box binding protein (TBP) (component of TFIID and TFIIIB)